jgi:hypothetical protein
MAYRPNTSLHLERVSDPDQWDAFEAQVRAMYKQMARIKITPLWAKLLDFQTRFPTPIEKLIRRAS